MHQHTGMGSRPFSATSVSEGNVVPISKDSGLITQEEIVEVQLLDAMVRQKREELGELVRKRNSKRDTLIQRVTDGAEVEPGPHTVKLRRALRVSLLLLAIPIALCIVSFTATCDLFGRPAPTPSHLRSNFGPKSTQYDRVLDWLAA